MIRNLITSIMEKAKALETGLFAFVVRNYFFGGGFEMIYIFHFNNISLEEVRAFVAYAETLETYRHCNIDWRKTKTTSEGSVAILCDKHDYEKLFVYLKQRSVLARIEAVPAKMYGRKNK